MTITSSETTELSSAYPANSYDPETLLRLQTCELAILDEVAALCDRYQITWFLEGGTLLGAMRHRGFIPWDDDMDIGMPRADYERFLEVAPQGLPSWLRLDNPAENLSMAAPFSKVCIRDSTFATQETIDAGYDQGIFIDVFPYDPVPEDARARNAALRAYRTAIRLCYLYYSGAITVPDRGLKGSIELVACRIAHGIVHAVCNPMTLRERLADAIATPPAMINTADPLLIVDPSIAPLRSSVIFPLTTVRFCGREYPAPGQTDAFLTNMYGDWRTLPPVDQRKSHKPVRLAFPA